MRLAGQAKLGFYPAHPGAIAALLPHLYLAPPKEGRTFDTINVIDPCAGEGDALDQIRRGLGVDPGHTYAVELDAARAAKIRELIPGSHVMGPASFLGAQITGFSFGLAYVNPPFDDELGGGRREEQTFAEHATRYLVPNGILVLVCPFKALIGNRGFVEFLDSRYSDAGLYKFPDGCRPFNEIVFIGKKRRTEVPTDNIARFGCLHKMSAHWRYLDMASLPALGSKYPTSFHNGQPSYSKEPDIRVWEVPRAWRPNTFKKTTFTDVELMKAIHDSPLNKLLREVKRLPPRRPPLPLDKGQLGLILASGILDGVVEGPHGLHVVRGSSHKVEYYNQAASTSDANPETGAVTTKDVYSQRMVTVIRCLDHNGVIYTHSNDVGEKEEEAEAHEHEHEAAEMKEAVQAAKGYGKRRVAVTAPW